MKHSASDKQQELISLLSEKSLGWLDDAQEQRLQSLMLEFPQVKLIDFELAAADATLSELNDIEPIEGDLYEDLTMDATSYFTDDELKDLVQEHKDKETDIANTQLDDTQPTPYHQPSSGRDDFITEEHILANEELANQTTELRSSPETHSSQHGMTNSASRLIKSDINHDDLDDTKKEHVQLLIEEMHTESEQKTWLRWIIALIVSSIAAYFWISKPDSPSSPTEINNQVEPLVLLSQTAGNITFDWSPSNKNAPLNGELIWDPTAKQGFIKMRNLPLSDDNHRYQLWVVDGERANNTPISAGLFEVKAGQEIIIPIKPSLPIRTLKSAFLSYEISAGATTLQTKNILAKTFIKNKIEN